MRNAWKRTAQTLLAASSLGLITTLPAIGFPIGKQQPAVTAQEDNPEFRKECEGNKAAMEIQLEFLADTSISNTDIHAYFRKGKLVIKGNANQQSVAKKAKSLAEKVTTIPIQDEIRVWPFPTYVTQKTSQENLQKAAEKCVHMELGALYPKLKAMAQADGTIMVKGPIISLEDKLEVSKKLRKIPGCTRVENQLEPQPMVRGKQTVILLTKDGQKFIPSMPKAVAKGMTNAPESWPVFQPVKPSENPPVIASTNTAKTPTIISAQNISPAQPIVQPVEKGAPKDLPVSVNTSIKATETIKSTEITEAPKSGQTWNKPVGKPLTLPEMQKPTAPTKQKENNTSALPPSNQTQVTPKTFPKVEAIPTSESKAKPPVFQPIPSAKLDKVEPSKPADKPTTKTETAKIEQTPIEPTAPKVDPIAARKGTPAHDPKGSVHVRTDALGFPQTLKEVPLAEARKNLKGNIPEQYQSVSDKNPSYERPYLAVKPTNSTSKPLATPSQQTMAKNNPSKNQIPETTKVATIKPSLTKTETSKNSQAIVAKPVALQPDKAPSPETPKITANTVSNAKGSKPKVGTGTVTFDDEPMVGKGTITFDDDSSNATKSALHESYKKTVLSLCKEEVREIQVTDQQGGKVTISLKMIKGKDITQVAKKLLSLPEFSQEKVDLEFRD